MTEKRERRPLSEEEARRRRAEKRRLEEARRKRKARRRRRILISAAAAVLALGLLIVGGIGLYHWASDWLHRPGSVLVRESYPLEYQDLIRVYAAENGLEPAYVAAVILAESSYRPEAVSAVGARGLMQLMEETAGDIAGWLGEPFDWDAMFDPETNIRYGCCLLGRLMRRYDNDMRCASSAYHQGPGTVDRWLSDPAYSEDGRTLAVIASDVTSNYVNKILRYYEKYAELYADAPEAGQ